LHIEGEEKVVSIDKRARLLRNNMAAVGAIVVAGFAGQAMAQEAPPARAADAEANGATDENARAGLEEIVVMARKREENLQDVPIATTALTGSQLAASGVTRSDQLQSLTPNLTISGGFETIPKVTLRGIGTNDFIQNLNPAVGTYVDEVYMGLATGQLLQLYDVSRVEVLRGPQGTLYGKNTTGGAVNIFSAKPEYGATGGALSASYGNYDYFSADGHLNLPLGDRVAMRVSFAARDRAGFFDNRFNGDKDRFQNVWHARFQLAVEPAEGVEFLMKLYAGKTNVDALHRNPVGVLDPAIPGRYLVGGVDVAGYSAPLEAHSGAHDAPTYDNVDEYGGSFTAKVELGSDIELTSITAFHDVKRKAQDDPDGGPFALIRNFYGNRSDFVSQEVRLSGELGKMTWILGGHYYREHHDVFDDFNFFECTLDNSCIIRANGPGYPPGNRFPGGPLAGVPIASNVDLRYDQKNVSYAAFAEAKFALTDNLGLTTGIRYTSEERNITSSSVTSLIARPSVASPFFPGYASFEGGRRWDNLSGRLILEYKPTDDAMIYASYSTGFRSGNWNGVAFGRVESIANPVNPEKLTSYEIGTKTEWFDNRLRLNLSGFYSKYDDLQVSIFVNATSILANAASAEIYGAEAELSAVPVEGLQARVALGYLHGKYRSFCDGGTAPVDPSVPFRAGCGNDLSGNRLVNAPRFTATASLDYEREFSGDWAWSIGGDIRLQSNTYFTAYNLEHLAQGGYALANFRARLANKADDYDISLWMTNAFNRKYAVDGNQIRAPFGMDLVAFGPPRMYGITVSGRF
jgi:iron complex outermembrane receptor protein